MEIKMAKIHIGGAGGAPSNGVIRSLRESGRKDHLIGTSSEPSDLFLAQTDERYAVPPATAPNYETSILRLLSHTKPDFLHVQNDYEVLAISRIRDKIEAQHIKHYLPTSETVENCIDKNKSYEIWKKAGIKVPETMILQNVEDLKTAFNRLGEKIWIRATVGGGGRGALPVNDFEFARIWIESFKGWGNFTAAECLTSKSITWLSIWHHGELVVAQTRRRHSWSFGNRTLSGVTGVTGVGETCSDDIVNRVAQDSILSIDPKPHGIFGVDMTYDNNGYPNPTEINIARFFTTIYFFTKAGLNMPEIYCNIALENKFPTLEKKINPLPDGLLWIRGMDVEPILTTTAELEKMKATGYE
jgi:carbamoyl-phosphate synthase large subunit